MVLLNFATQGLDAGSRSLGESSCNRKCFAHFGHYVPLFGTINLGPASHISTSRTAEFLNMTLDMLQGKKTVHNEMHSDEYAIRCQVLMLSPLVYCSPLHRVLSDSQI